MKRNGLSWVAVVVCLALLVASPVLAGPPSGGRSRGANTWEAKHGGYGAAVYAAPVYVVPAATGAAAPASNGSYYYAPDAAPEAGNAAVLDVRVPANAEIWLNDYKTKLTGPAREFIYSPLSTDMNYRYHVRVRWMENGQEVVQERDVPVAPGTRTSVQFAGVSPASTR
jgi:uncharacterized protein (TIGR03000 family)